MKPDPLDATTLLRRYKIHPNKRLGQNFLVDEEALQRVTEAADIQMHDTVLEIGPGLGGLTRWLATYARQVVAVELDAGLIQPLMDVMASYPNVQIVQGDILSFDPVGLISETGSQGAPSYLVVANIPYYITSAVIRHLLEASRPPERLVLTVQREVAERICAIKKKMSLLALSVQVYGKPQIIAHIPSGAFYPAPKVDSSIVRVDLYPQPLIAKALLDDFFRLAKAGFSQRRKNLRNALSGGMRWSPQQADSILCSAGIDPKRRAETLDLEEWGELVNVVQDAGLK